jgi:hypothetical protein
MLRLVRARRLDVPDAPGRHHLAFPASLALAAGLAPFDPAVAFAGQGGGVAVFRQGRRAASESLYYFADFENMPTMSTRGIELRRKMLFSCRSSLSYPTLQVSRMVALYFYLQRTAILRIFYWEICDRSTSRNKLERQIFRAT